MKNDVHARHRGFTLIEILVAMALISMTLLLIPTDRRGGSREQLEQVIDDFSRMVRFCSNEAILQNKVVRLRLMLNKSPLEYVVEKGPESPVIIPKWAQANNLSLREQEDQEEKRSEFNARFQKVSDFSELTRELPTNVYFVAAANEKDTQIIESGEYSIYFFPDGVRDGTLLIFATDWEAAGLIIPSLSNKIRTLYYPFEDDNLAYEEQIERSIDELIDRWMNGE